MAARFGPRIRGRRIPVAVAKSEENWNEYLLADGTVLRVRQVLLGVSRIEGKTDDRGDPVYEISGGPVLDARVPYRRRKRNGRPAHSSRPGLSMESGRFVACTGDMPDGPFRAAMVKKLLKAKAAKPVKTSADAQEFLNWLEAK